MTLVITSLTEKASVPTRDSSHDFNSSIHYCPVPRLDDGVVPLGERPLQLVDLADVTLALGGNSIDFKNHPKIDPNNCLEVKGYLCKLLQWLYCQPQNRPKNSQENHPKKGPKHWPK